MKKNRKPSPNKWEAMNFTGTNAGGTPMGAAQSDGNFTKKMAASGEAAAEALGGAVIDNEFNSSK